MPRIAKIVAICVSNCNECLNGINVLLLHFCNAGTGSQQGKTSKGLYISISFKLQERETSTKIKSPKNQRKQLAYKFFFYGQLALSEHFPAEQE